MDKFKKLLHSITPILIKPGQSAITISLSKRFFLYRMMNSIVNIIEEDPYLNFIALLKNFKLLGRFLNGTLAEFYRDRNKIYFKKFFYDRDLYELVKKDLEYFYPECKDFRMTITKKGVIIYENYKKNNFNLLLLTIHSGTWVPKSVEKKLSISARERFVEEDIDSHKLYGKLIIEKGGIWIDNKQSRFLIDFNRGLKRAIYANNSEEWLKVMWKEELTKAESEEIFDSYREFYFTLSRLIESYQFNIIFDAHTMKHLPGRPNISFGTNYIPRFYMPIVKSMQHKMASLGYSPVHLNNPFQGGYILKWLSQRFPNAFIFSMEVNKKLYMSSSRTRTFKNRLEKVSQDLTNIFDIEVDYEPEQEKKA